MKNINYKYNIGDIITTSKRSHLLITGRRYIIVKNGDKLKLYKYKCLDCGFDYTNFVAVYKENKRDYWIPEYNLKDHKCICCNNRVVVKGINDIITTDPRMIPYFENINDAYTHHSHSGYKIYPICPECGTKANTTQSINRILRNHGISCRCCNDGFSYPNKIIYSILKQLNIDFDTEHSFDWIDSRKYDFYIKNYNLIIEAHGDQHYNECSLTKRTLAEEQKNDKMKEETALKNGIKKYIIIDCRKSELEYIKKSIMESELPNILGFSDKDINWNECEIYSQKSIIKEVCEYYNTYMGLTSHAIAEYFKIATSTVVNYLKIGSHFKWCDYDPLNEMKKSALKNRKKQMQPIRCIENNYVFYCQESIEKNSINIFGKIIWRANISKHINGKLKHAGVYHFCNISQEQFNKIKLESPELAYGDSFEL